MNFQNEKEAILAPPAGTISARTLGWTIAFFILALGLLSFLQKVTGSQNSFRLLSYLFSYFSFLFATIGLYFAVPERFKEIVLILSSVLFLMLVVSPFLACALVIATSLLYLILQLHGRQRFRLILFALWIIAFYTWIPRHVLTLSTGKFGELSLPIDFVILHILLKTFKRTLFCYYEVSAGRAKRFSLLHLLCYMISLPFLTGIGITPSFQHFIESKKTADMDQCVLKGLHTCLVCLCCLLGLITLGKVLSNPALNLIPAPSPDLFQLPPWRLWMMFFAWYLLDYLLRMSCEQLGVGVCRMFGYGIKDAYVRPLLSQSFADFWRRWDVLWREYLLSAFYYPLALKLGRRFGGTKPWILFASAWTTFMAGGALLLFPQVFFLVAYPHTDILRLALPVLAYNIMAGSLAGFSVFMESKPRARKTSSLPFTGAKIAVTFALVSMCNVLFNPSLSVLGNLRLLAAALGF